jgi:hypothetical protein
LHSALTFFKCTLVMNRLLTRNVDSIDMAT